jgi:hypothetical protein
MVGSDAPRHATRRTRCHQIRPYCVSLAIFPSQGRFPRSPTPSAHRTPYSELGAVIFIEELHRNWVGDDVGRSAQKENERIEEIAFSVSQSRIMTMDEEVIVSRTRLVGGDLGADAMMQCLLLIFFPTPKKQ